MWNPRLTYIFNVVTIDPIAYDDLLRIAREHGANSDLYHWHTDNGSHHIMCRITSGYPEAFANVVAHNLETITSYTVETTEGL